MQSKNIINLCILCLSSVFLDFYSVVRMKILLWMNWQKLDDCFNVTPYENKNETILVSFLYLWVVNAGKKMRFYLIFLFGRCNQTGLLSFLFILICICKNTPFITMYIFTFKPESLIKRFTRGCVV